MPSSAENTVEELLHIAKQAGNRPLERLLADTAVWYYQNHKRIPRENIVARCAFYEKAIWCMIELNALMAERLHELEAGRRGAKHLWLPRGIKANGSDEYA